MNPLHRQFPPDFVWGVATSSFQIEGAAHEDGKGESIWDRFCQQPGAIADASNGDVACDHYHRLDEDLDLIAALGVNCYRFSIAWPRVQPLGHGDFNPKGLDFYERLVDGLKRRGIQAFATLNHWDLPQGLQDRGGWNDRDTVHRFVDYARHVQARIGDRLDGLTTHNEPWVVAVLGHEQGNFAPGIKSRRIAAQVSHHLLLSHGLALQALRADGARSLLGIVLNLSSCMPATAMPADIAAARLADSRGRRWYTDPLFKGHYPDDVLAELGADAPVVQPGDMAAIAQPMDYLGVNYYTRSVLSASGEDWKAGERGLPVSDMGWEIYPQGLTDLLVLLHRDYPDLPPVYVTENGGAFKDDAVANGRVQDDDRTAYLRDHIAAVANAMQQGVPMAGYMVWSLMDNFEWASGYLKRFGIVHVDYATQARTPKASAEWYRQFLQDWRR
ncbi:MULTISPECIES: GH1 family beta-glucosidase [Roseateles]|uniref:Beta-glucosidase n=1 Tax=Pelomonas aquatica TaxID=431058 RepID=A0ABU1ZEM8_9BURK|nr:MULTISPECIES: GH1 family beta-glucosidase [Roseateles]KQY86788.1 beta-glucosidase [Pelomonas sp. Root1444]MDR7299073.1 beta-glucosidase [Pelomonas aquatica]